MIKEVSNRINHYADLNAHFDVLGDIFDTLRFRGTIFFRSKLAAPWGMSVEQMNNPRFHIALRGHCVIGTDEPQQADQNTENTENINNIINVNHMDIVMLPHGDQHWIADQYGRELTPSEHAADKCELGSPLFQQGEITHQLICGLVHYDEDILHPIIASLPSVLHFSSFAPDDPIWIMVNLIDSEMKTMHSSKTAIIDRLTEVLFLQLLNKYVHENEGEAGFFAALRNPRIHHALALIHQQPQTNWTLEVLGEHVGMSRATLARQFKTSVGMPPMTYISHWRMMKAHHLLKYSRRTVDQIAELVGFSTARTLNKAFLRHYGYTPKQLRTQT